MLFYPLRALSVNGRQVEFAFTDIPRLLDEHTFFLSARPGSELLLKNTIVRGSDMFSMDGKRLYENDIVCTVDETQYYIVSFYKGFKLRSKEGEEIFLPQLPALKYLGSWYELANTVTMPDWLRRACSEPKLITVQFYDTRHKHIFNLFDLDMARNDLLLLHIKLGVWTTVADVRQYMNSRLPDGRRLYYGMDVPGYGRIEMYLGRPGIMTDDNEFFPYSAKGVREIIKEAFTHVEDDGSV